MNLRVATFNVRFGRALDGWNSWLPFRWRAAATVLADLDADLVGLQEAYAFQVRSLRRHVRGYGRTGDGRSDKRTGERCTVLYRDRVVRLTDSSTRWYGKEPFVAGTMLPNATHPRIATLADFVLADDGPAFTFVSTHLDQRHPENRVASAEQLAGWLDADRPTIVVGDLNAGPESDVLGVLEAAGLRSAVPDDAPGTNHDYGKHVPRHRIDHILVSRHWTFGEATVVTEKPRGRFPSDHWPVVVDLDLADG